MGRGMIQMAVKMFGGMDIAVIKGIQGGSAPLQLLSPWASWCSDSQDEMQIVLPAYLSFLGEFLLKLLQKERRDHS